MQAVVIRAWSSGPVRPGLGLERGDRALDLGPAALHPLRPAQRGRPDQALVGGGADLVDRAGRERDQPQHAAPLGALRGHERTLGPDGLIEPVEDRRRVDQHLAIVEHERGDAAERVDLPHGIEVAEHRAGVVLVGKAQHAQRHREAAHVGRIVLADEDHPPILRDRQLSCESPAAQAATPGGDGAREAGKGVSVGQPLIRNASAGEPQDPARETLTEG